MRTSLIWQISTALLACAILILLPGSAQAAKDAPFQIYLPAVLNQGSSQPGGAIIVDHTSTDISQIPDYWLNQAKLLAVHYAHTSHGGQILEGMAYLKDQVDSKYDFAIAYDPPSLPSGSNKLKFYDGNNYSGNNYITPEMYWASPEGITHTQSVLSTGLFQYSTWTWCGQQSGNSPETVAEYLSTLNSFEVAFPSTRIIYFTGHTDGTQDNPDSDLQRNNNLVRQYVDEHDKILFDFADIESYDPDGVYHPNVSDGCEWCTDWCAAHPGYCTNLPYCAHSHGLQCKLKAQAFWWLMARLAGWPGPTQ